MVEQCVQRDLERRNAVSAGGHCSAQKAGCQRRVIGGRQAHRQSRKCGVGNSPVMNGLQRIDVLRLVKVPTGKNPGNVGHVALGIRLYLVTAGIALFGTVEIELIQPDGTQLHHLTAIVFIRCAAGCRVFLHVAFGVEVKPHRRIKRHALQQRAVITESVGRQQIPPGRNAVAAPVETDARQRHNKKL